jgi:hypothetical protein
MRKTLILTLVLSVFAVIAYAQTGGTAATSGTSTTTTSTTATSGTGGTTTSTTTTHKAHKAKKASHTYKGTVASVDATAQSFVVHSASAKVADVTLKVNAKTKYSPAGKGWDDVKVDAKVSGSYKNDGTDNWAVTVKFAADKAPAKSTSK